MQIHAGWFATILGDIWYIIQQAVGRKPCSYLAICLQALHQHACPLAANTEAALKTVTEHSRAVGRKPKIHKIS